MARGAAYHAWMIWDDEVDACGLICPLPVLKARKRLLAMASGQVLRLLTTDPASIIDVPHFCAQSGHEVLETASEGPTVSFLIQRGACPPAK